MRAVRIGAFWQRDRRKHLTETVLQLFPTMVDAFLIGVENDGEPRHVRLFDFAENRIQQFAIALEGFYFKHLWNGMRLCDGIDDMLIIFPLNQQDAFIIHYRTSVPNRVALPNSSSE